MKAIDATRLALKFSDMGMEYLDTMSDAPLLRPGGEGGWGGNHAMWIAGHLTVVEGRLQQMLHGTVNPVARWKPLFDWGSEPRWTTPRGVSAVRRGAADVRRAAGADARVPR